MPYVDLDGIRFHYQQTGPLSQSAAPKANGQASRPDVVLVHAVTSNLAVWLFSNIVDALANDFRVTLYDLRGHGMSDAPPSGYTSADMAGDLHKLHTALGLKPAYLVGHSYGAVIAMHTAVLYPEIVKGLVLSDPYFPGLKHLEPNLGRANVWQDLQEVFARAGADIGPEVDFARLFQLVADLTPEQINQIKQAMGAAGARWLLQLPRLAETTCGADAFAEAGLTAERLCAVEQPVVALYDEHTPFQATCRFLREHLKNCLVEIVPGAKHVAVLQNPASFVNLVQKHLGRMVEMIEPAGSALR